MKDMVQKTGKVRRTPEERTGTCEKTPAAELEDITPKGEEKWDRFEGGKRKVARTGSVSVLNGEDVTSSLSCMTKGRVVGLCPFKTML